jgi:signal transduction histidine kinase
MNSLRVQVIFLVLAAMIGISIISVAAHMTFETIRDMNQANVMFRYTPDNAASKAVGGGPKLADTIKVVPTEPGDVQIPIPLVIGVYVTLIFVSAGFVAVVVGNMIARPLFILDKAIDSVDPREVIPLMRENGNLENKETIKLLNRLSEKIKQAMESRMRLVAAAGHDLRTPLQRMRLRVEFIEDDKTRETWLKDIEEMTNIANSAITLVKEEVAANESEIVRLGDLVREIVDDLQIIGHQVHLGKVADCEVIGGYLSLKRAFQNVIVNAATHGKGARVLLKRDKNNAILQVLDNGPGIPDDLIGKAFEPFFRTDRARQKQSTGAGLGLAIVKEIIQRHKGTISLSNRQPQGLAQEIVLPLASV